MRNDDFRNRVLGIGVMVIVLFFLAGTMPVPVSAADRDGYYGRDRYSGYGQWDKDRVKRYAFLLGYHTAYSEGRDTRGYRGNYKDMQGYQDGMNGYLDWMGHEKDYRNNYRKGYKEGFNDAQNMRQRKYDREDVERVLGDSLRNVYGSDDGRTYRNRGVYNRGRNQGTYGNNREYGGYDGYGGYGGRYTPDQIRAIADRKGYSDGMGYGRDDRDHNRRRDLDQIDKYRKATDGYKSEFGDREIYRQGYREGFRRGYYEGLNLNTRGNRRIWPF